MNDLQKKIYERFVKYVKVDTTSDGMSQTVPTTATQLEFGKMLAAEMKEIGFSNVNIDKNGFVFGEIPANHSSSKKTKPTESVWGKYLRVNHTEFSGNTNKYPYEPELPNING